MHTYAWIHACIRVSIPYSLATCLVTHPSTRAGCTRTPSCNVYMYAPHPSKIPMKQWCEQVKSWIEQHKTCASKARHILILLGELVGLWRLRNTRDKFDAETITRRFVIFFRFLILLCPGGTTCVRREQKLVPAWSACCYSYLLYPLVTSVKRLHSVNTRINTKSVRNLIHLIT